MRKNIIEVAGIPEGVLIVTGNKGILGILTFDPKTGKEELI